MNDEKTTSGSHMNMPPLPEPIAEVKVVKWNNSRWISCAPLSIQDLPVGALHSPAQLREYARTYAEQETASIKAELMSAYEDGEQTVKDAAEILRQLRAAEQELDAAKKDAERFRGLLRRVEEALQRHLDGHAPRRIPVDDSDSDILLVDVRAALNAERKNDA